MKHLPELLMPAGSLDKLKVAYEFGADAVYAGAPYYSLRTRENGFTIDTLSEGVKIARHLKKKIYLTVNIFARNLKLKPFQEQLDQLIALKCDALIMSDPGLIAMVRERAPEQQIHLSVQANCMNWQSVRFWQSQGIERVILSRELRLEEIREINRQVPNIELEAFVHGSLCIAYSGRCLLSHYMSYRDANQGVCDNSCRYPFKVLAQPSSAKAGPVILATEEQEYFLEDHRNPGELYQIDEDENGSYIMNSKDLCLIENLGEIAAAGVCSFKVEGRTKSDFYVALVTSCYRKAIDDLAAGRPFDRRLLDLLVGSANRGYTKGFMGGEDPVEFQNYEPNDRPGMSLFVGRISDVASTNGKITLDIRGTIEVGKELRVLSKNGITRCKVQKLWDPKSNEVSVLHSGRSGCFAEFDTEMTAGAFLMKGDS